jgi:hypothetical protein
MGEYDMGFFLGLLTGVILSFVLIYLYIRNLIRKVMSELDRHIDQVKDKLMPVVIERVNGQLYCYTEPDKQFICQGVNMAEIKQAFEVRHPDMTAYLAGGEKELIEELRTQLKELNEAGISK